MRRRANNRSVDHGAFFHDWSALIGAAFIFALLLLAGLTQGCTTVRVQDADQEMRPLREPNADDLQREDPPSLYCKQWRTCTNIYDA